MGLILWFEPSTIKKLEKRSKTTGTKVKEKEKRGYIFNHKEVGEKTIKQ